MSNNLECPSCYVRLLEGFEAIGEADCKFPRWVSYIAAQHPAKAVDIIVEATDSDYILIGMMQYEMMARQATATSQKKQPSTLGRVSVRRILTSVNNDEALTAASAPAALKQKQKKKSSARTMEFVHIPLLYETMQLCIRRLVEASPDQGIMGSLLGIVALNGTDFCRAIPAIKPERMWKFLQEIVQERGGGKLRLIKRKPPMLAKDRSCCSDKTDCGSCQYVFDEVSFSLPPPIHNNNTFYFLSNLEDCFQDEICDHVLTHVYAKVYPTQLQQLRARGEGFQAMSDYFKSSECRLSDKTKSDFPSVGMLVTTIRNASWNAAYWHCAAQGNMQPLPDPMQIMYGYVVGEDGRPQWLDEAVAGAAPMSSKRGRKESKTQ